MVRQASIGLPAGPVSPFRRSVVVQQALAYLRQVDKHRRTLDQFCKVLTSSTPPPIVRGLVEDVLTDMLETGLITSRTGVYEPDSAGWDFITSNRIYSNIQPAPYEVSLVDADSGKTVATIAGVGRDPSGVRVAGRSYHLLPGGSAFRQKVRRGGDYAEPPEYHPGSVPYAFDVGASLSAYLGIPNNILAIIPLGESIVVMTWLGRLMNAAIAEGIRRQGLEVSDKSFSLRVRGVGEGDVLPLLQRAADSVVKANPLGSVKVEWLTQLGPHFYELSPNAQRRAREDWLDCDFLQTWIKRIDRVQVFNADDQLGADMTDLAKV